MFDRLRLALEDADTAPGGSPSPQPQAEPSADERAAAERLAKAEKKLAAAEKRETERKQKEQEAIDAKRVAEGETKTVLAETQAKLKAATDRLASIEAAEKQRADALFSSLPEDRQAALSVVKDSLPVDKWAALLAAESKAPAATETAPKTLPPPTGAPMAETRRNRDNYTPTAEATEILEQLGHSDEMLRKLRKAVDTDGDVATYKFTTNLKDWLDMMPKYRPHETSLQALANRDAG
jgi:hypothetical protein